MRGRLQAFTAIKLNKSLADSRVRWFNPAGSDRATGARMTATALVQLNHLTRCQPENTLLITNHSIERFMISVTLTLHLRNKKSWSSSYNLNESPGEEENISTLSLTSEKRGLWLTPHPYRFTPERDTRYPLYSMLGGPQGRSGRVRKTWPPPVFWSPDRPALSESLYRLSYSVPLYVEYNHKIWLTVQVQSNYLL